MDSLYVPIAPLSLIDRFFFICLFFSQVCTSPYEGPDIQVATKLMEEAKIREQEAMLSLARPEG